MMMTVTLQEMRSRHPVADPFPIARDTDAISRIRRSLDTVQGWIERNDYRGYDPGDGLTSWARPFTFGNLFAERVLQQVVWKSPINLRPVLGIRPLDSTKGRGFAAWGYFLRYASEGDESARAKGEACLTWLNENRSPNASGFCWGNHFDFSTRSGRMPAHQPTIVWSALIGQAFLTAFEATGESRWLESADRICEWILGIPRERTSTGTCLSYVEYEQSSIHNSNVLGAGLLARTWHHTSDERYLTIAHDAFRYTCSRQNADGSWFYGEEERYRWIDSFHTGYVLDSLKRYIDATGDGTFHENLDRGFDYYGRTFFENTGRPRYYNDRLWPIDIQCAAQAIDTFSFFSEGLDDFLERAVRVALWTIEHMQDRTGFFHYRRYPLVKSRTPYFHWGQATMFAALSRLSGKLGGGAIK
jgi:rhamnogalacturonyl hydrolase YesR